MYSESARFTVVTGGPGAGKSALIDRLRKAGYAHSEEAGRAIIQDQVAIGGRALPRVDPDMFAEMMLCWELRSYRLAAGEPGTVFFDRGIPDIVGYLRLEARNVPEHIHIAAQKFRYHRVFVAPPWPEIYEQDSEREQSFREAEQTHEAVVTAYREYGYELRTLPRTSVEERFRFLTAHSTDVSG